MLKYLSKFALDILPSVVATIIGAYIVNHYIITKPADPAVAAVSTADPKKAGTGATPDQAAKPDARNDAKAERATDTSPDAAKAVDLAKPSDASEKPTETANAPADVRRHKFVVREKAIAKIAPVTVPAVVPSQAASAGADERRDANDLARAAIERLRRSSDSPARAQELAREPARPAEPSRTPAASAAIQPLPPAITVATPSRETNDRDAGATASISVRPPYPAQAADNDASLRLTPPADIPSSLRPLDLRANAEGTVPSEHPTVADDVLSAAKSVFHAVLPR